MNEDGEAQVVLDAAPASNRAVRPDSSHHCSMLRQLSRTALLRHWPSPRTKSPCVIRCCWQVDRDGEADKLMGQGPAAPCGLIEVAYRNELLELARWRAQFEGRSAELEVLHQLLLRKPQAFSVSRGQQLDEPAVAMFY